MFLSFQDRSAAFVVCVSFVEDTPFGVVLKRNRKDTSAFCGSPISRHAYIYIYITLG